MLGAGSPRKRLESLRSDSSSESLVELMQISQPLWACWGPRPWLGVLWLTSSPLCSYRIVCEMGEAKPSQHAGFVEICVAVCRPEFMARSSQLYYFMVSPGCHWSTWLQTAANLTAANAEQGLHPLPVFMGTPCEQSRSLAWCPRDLDPNSVPPCITPGSCSGPWVPASPVWSSSRVTPGNCAQTQPLPKRKNSDKLTHFSVPQFLHL